jgi:hypothetical protein
MTDQVYSCQCSYCRECLWGSCFYFFLFFSRSIVFCNIPGASSLTLAWCWANKDSPQKQTYAVTNILRDIVFNLIIINCLSPSVKLMISQAHIERQVLFQPPVALIDRTTYLRIFFFFHAVKLALIFLLDRRG